MSAKASAAKGSRKTLETTLDIEGMNCAACASRVEKQLTGVAGVELASVNLSTEAAHVEYDCELVDMQQLKQAVVDAGYAVRDELDNGEGRRERKLADIRGQRRTVLAALVFWLPLFALEMTRMAGIQPPDFHTFAAPGFPSPTVRISLLTTVLPMSNAHGTDPLTKPIIIQMVSSSIYSPPISAK